MRSFRNRLASVSGETERFVTHSMDIAGRLQLYIDSEGINQKLLAKRLARKESEVSKWMSGEHNFTIATISKLEATLEIEIIPYWERKLDHEDDFLKITLHTFAASYISSRPSVYFTEEGEFDTHKTANIALMEFSE